MSDWIGRLARQFACRENRQLPVSPEEPVAIGELRNWLRSSPSSRTPVTLSKVTDIVLLALRKEPRAAGYCLCSAEACA